VDNLGFYVWRAPQRQGEYQPISELIAGHGSSTEPHDYLYRDADVVSQRTYFYKLRQVDMEGSEIFHGPIEVFAGVTAVDQATWGKIKLKYR